MTKLSKINHFSHQHQLVWKHPQEPYQCNGCKELGFGPCYECEQPNCDYHLHDECANPDPTITHPFMRGCTFKFHQKAPQMGYRICDACGRDVLGFVYQCTHKDPFDLHPHCAKLPHTLASGEIKLKLKKKLPSPCKTCGSTKTADGFRGWCYASSSRSECYHITCVKDTIVRNWKMGHFGQANHETSGLALESFAPPSRQVVVGRGWWWGGSSTARKVCKVVKTAITLVISAIFGDPTTLILALAEQLFSK
ncbi:hypothetical protein K2173_011891 [Erythroxylum novogranatense]|uniref:DC1 domain-containing protein n=1 Tax=Erythroxylum novogranatense TaxID=1862640 RepID=A0AAV8T243_9ROSI|nr:hypothetical protein K2173_011891 [Erythroxylum novogranatense]